jgi:hypothetical protein
LIYLLDFDTRYIAISQFSVLSKMCRYGRTLKQSNSTKN